MRFLGYDPRPEPQTLGQQLVHLREAQGLSQRVLAKALGVDPLTLRRWEHDQYQPAKEFLKKLTQMFPVLIKTGGLMTDREG